MGSVVDYCINFIFNLIALDEPNKLNQTDSEPIQEIDLSEQLQYNWYSIPVTEIEDME